MYQNVFAPVGSHIPRMTAPAGARQHCTSLLWLPDLNYSYGSWNVSPTGVFTKRYGPCIAVCPEVVTNDIKETEVPCYWLS